MMSHSTMGAGDELTAHGLDPAANDTTLSPVLFRDGQDRRTSPRVPISGPVRMGPPGGEPYAVVSASDLSTGGLFIDADRAVKVGARFCLEITLSSGDIVYVAEAEVAYNRERVNGSGFGVRFVDVPVDVAAKLEREVGRHTHDVALDLPKFPSLPPVSQIEILESKDAEETKPGKRRRAKKGVNLTEPVMNEDAETLTPRPAGDSLLAPPLATMRPDSSAVSALLVPSTSPSLKLAQTLDVDAVPPEAFDDEGGATEIPARRGLDLALDETAYPEPVLASDLSSDLLRGVSLETGNASKNFDVSDVASTSDAPASRRSVRSMMEGVMRVGQDARQLAVERAREYSPVWTGLAALGLVTVMSAVGLTIWLGSSAQAVEPAPKSSEVGMTATTQRVLMGEKAAKAEPKKPAPAQDVRPLTAQTPSASEGGDAKADGTAQAAPKNPLPPLVVVDESSPEVLKKPELEPAKTEAAEAAKVEAAKVDAAKVEAAKVEAAKVEAAKIEAAKAEAAKVEAAKVEAAKVEAAKAEAAKVETAKADAAKKESSAAKELASRIRAELAEEQPKVDGARTKGKERAPSASRVRIGLSSGAKVAKTHVLKAPDRFVIDVTGQKGTIDTPAIGGAIKAVRVGKHPDHTRIVIETKAPIARAKASKSGSDLTVAIEYK
ncbi:PilZ domain-containing protein [Myxococcota bacterium]|nr:PilZ domain-containing protein [Myxococcota bacterium]